MTLLKLKTFIQTYKKYTVVHNINIYYIGYIMMKNHVIIYSVNPLCFIIGEVDGYIEKNDGNKYLVFASIDKNNEVLTKYTKF